VCRTAARWALRLARTCGEDRRAHRPSAYRCDKIEVPAITLHQLCADWLRLDLVKFDARHGEDLVSEDMQKTLRPFPHAVVILEMLLQRDRLPAANLLDQSERAGCTVHTIGEDEKIMPIDLVMILSQPQDQRAL
jgi:hypothetical protein